MGPEELARLQFALTVGFHFLLVTLTLGLVTLVAVSHTRWVRTGDPVHRRMTTYWGTLYVINYAVGIASGLAMEFQLGANWTGLESTAASVFGAPLAVETVVSFFAESTFLALWIFGWDRLPRRVHLACIWLVAAAAWSSALWALLANGFMQNPVAYTWQDGRLELTSFGALFANPNAWVAIAHIAGGALMAGGFFMLGVSVLLQRRGRAEAAFVRHSMRTGAHAGAWGAALVVASGVVQLERIKGDQPLKDAVIGGDQAEITRQVQELSRQFGPLDLPPSGLLLTSVWAMIVLGGLLLLLGLWTLLMLRRDRLMRSAALHRLLLAATVLPFVANIAGWIVREVGRQPFVITGLLTTRQAMTPGLGTGRLTASLVVLVLLIGGLLVLDWLLLARAALRGPAGTSLGQVPPPPEDTSTPSGSLGTGLVSAGSGGAGSGPQGVRPS